MSLFLFRISGLFCCYLFFGCQYKSTNQKTSYAFKDWNVPQNTNRIKYYTDTNLSKQNLSFLKEYFDLGGLKDRLVEKTIFYTSKKDAYLTIIVGLTEFDGNRVLLESKYEVDVFWRYDEKNSKIPKFYTRISHDSNSIECRNFTIIIAPAYNEISVVKGIKRYRHYFRFQYLYNVRSSNCNEPRFQFKENDPRNQVFPKGDIANIHEIELFGIED